MASALLLLYPLIRSLKSKTKTIKPPLDQRLNPRTQGIKDLLAGTLIAAGLLTLLALLLHLLHYTRPEDNFNLAKALKKAIAPAIFAALIEEWLFRGVLYDLLNRTLTTTQTIISLSLLFAALHFLTPPEGATITDPTSPTAGFHMLALIGLKFLDPASFLGVFLTLFTIGLILAYARHRTGYLWLPIGLHLGWVLAFKSFHKLTEPTGNANPILYNQNINEGLLPLATLLITALILHLYLKPKNTWKLKLPQ